MYNLQLRLCSKHADIQVQVLYIYAPLSYIYSELYCAFFFNDIGLDLNYYVCVCLDGYVELNGIEFPSVVKFIFGSTSCHLIAKQVHLKFLQNNDY